MSSFKNLSEETKQKSM